MILINNLRKTEKTIIINVRTLLTYIYIFFSKSKSIYFFIIIIIFFKNINGKNIDF